MNQEEPVTFKRVFFKFSFTFFLFLSSILFTQYSFAQNSKIKCYFNHPVNNAVAEWTNAIYLNTTFADTLIAYINRTKYTIDFCVYDYYLTPGDGMDAIATAVNAAYARGVVIRWIGNGSSSNNGWANLNSNIKTLGSPTSSSYGICHNKFVVFDASSANANDPIVWTGSYNFTIQQNDYDYNNILIIQDKLLAQAYYKEFNKMWGGTGAAPTSSSKFGTHKTVSAQNTFTVNGTPIEVYFSPKDNSQTHFINSVNTVNNELFFGIYTFTDTSFANNIKAKKNTGISVTGIMDQYSNTFAPYTTLLAVMGNSLKIYSNYTYLYHNKIMLIDALHAASDPQTIAGSFNWTTSSENSNDENMIIIHDADIANQYYQSVCKNFTDVGGTACPAIAGIEAYDYGQQQVAVFPNPTADVITIKVKNAGSVLKISITDCLGNIVKRAEVFSNDEINLDVHNLLAGLYFVNINRGDKIFTQKFLKQ